MQDYETAARDFAALIDALGLSVHCYFVPFSQSRNAGEKSPSLNWCCSVMRQGRPIAGLGAVDYMQGSGHTPASKAGAKRFPVRADLQRAIALECERGKRAGLASLSGQAVYATAAAISPPTAADVIAALCQG